MCDPCWDAKKLAFDFKRTQMLKELDRQAELNKKIPEKHRGGTGTDPQRCF